MAPSTRSRTAQCGHQDPIPRVPLIGISPQLESRDSGVDRRSSFYKQTALQHRVAAPASAIQQRKRQAILTIPTILTLLRVVMVPILMMCWYLDHVHAPVATAAVFIFASVTDWLDGFLARKFEVVSAFGAFLDPVADKIMVATALILLCTQPPPPISVPAMVVPASAIISREITMSALREWAATSGGEAHSAVKVSSLGKWKTALQMTSMSLLLVLRNDHLVSDEEWTVMALHNATLVSFSLLVMATVLALWSLARYMENVWEHFTYVVEHPATTNNGLRKQ